MFEANGGAAVQSGDLPSAAAKATVGPVPLVIAVEVRHYCCCVSEEEVLHVTHRAGLAVRRAPDREYRRTHIIVLLWI